MENEFITSIKLIASAALPVAAGLVYVSRWQAKAEAKFMAITKQTEANAESIKEFREYHDSDLDKMESRISRATSASEKRTNIRLARIEDKIDQLMMVNGRA